MKTIVAFGVLGLVGRSVCLSLVCGVRAIVYYFGGGDYATVCKCYSTLMTMYSLSPLVLTKVVTGVSGDRHYRSVCQDPPWDPLRILHEHQSSGPPGIFPQHCPHLFLLSRTCSSSLVPCHLFFLSCAFSPVLPLLCLLLHSCTSSPVHSCRRYVRRPAARETDQRWVRGRWVRGRWA